jgi:hypothetical protein
MRMGSAALCTYTAQAVRAYTISDRGTWLSLWQQGRFRRAGCHFSKSASAVAVEVQQFTLSQSAAILCAQGDISTLRRHALPYRGAKPIQDVDLRPSWCSLVTERPAESSQRDRNLKG